MFAAAIPYLQASRQPLLICHVAPDGDAIGSMLGLKLLLEAQGKTAVAACADPVPRALRILPGAGSVTSEARGGEYDLVIALDCSDMDRLGDVYQPALHGGLPSINLDHHITNVGFGTVNLVDSGASSTAELVFRLAQAMRWTVDKPVAQCLLAGILTDTRGFRTSNVKPAVLGMAQELMEAGASLGQLAEDILDRRPIGSICLWGKALAQLKLEGRVIRTQVTRDMRARCGGIEATDSGLVNFLLSAEDADVALILAERDDGRIDVGMRAKRGFDVAEVAVSLGGGGHTQAAGCSLDMDLAQAEIVVMDALRASLARQAGAERTGQ